MKTQNVTSFMGSDDTRYVVALIEPNKPNYWNE